MCACVCLYNICDLLFTVTENQSQNVVTPQVATKPSPAPFGISAQPFRLGWNPDVKAKQEEVRWQSNLCIMHASPH